LRGRRCHSEHIQDENNEKNNISRKGKIVAIVAKVCVVSSSHYGYLVRCAHFTVRVVDKIGGRYTRLADKKQSTHIFKSNGSWVKVSITVEKIAIDETHGIQNEI
jgi:hypothetical protein